MSLVLNLNNQELVFMSEKVLCVIFKINWVILAPQYYLQNFICLWIPSSLILVIQVQSFWLWGYFYVTNTYLIQKEMLLVWINAGLKNLAAYFWNIKQFDKVWKYGFLCLFADQLNAV